MLGAGLRKRTCIGAKKWHQAMEKVTGATVSVGTTAEGGRPLRLGWARQSCGQRGRAARPSPSPHCLTFGCGSPGGEGAALHKVIDALWLSVAPGAGQNCVAAAPAGPGTGGRRASVPEGDFSAHQACTAYTGSSCNGWT